MAVTCSRAGRPCFIADIDPSNDEQLALRDVFHNACKGFCYRDIAGLARMYGVTTRTVDNWKYGLTYPRKDIAQQIINWVEAGKPMKQKRPFPEDFDMF